MQNQDKLSMILFKMIKNWRFDMILQFLKWFCFIEILIEWHNSQKAYKKQTLVWFCERKMSDIHGVEDINCDLSAIDVKIHDKSALDRSLGAGLIQSMISRGLQRNVATKFWNHQHLIKDFH